MRPVYSKAAFALLLLLARFQPSFGADPTSPRDRFLTEAPAAWTEFEKTHPELVVEAITVTTVKTPDSDATYKERIVAKVHGRMKLLQRTSWPGEGKLPQAILSQPRVVKDRIDILNEDHSLALRREGDAPWKLLRIEPRNDGARWLGTSIFRLPWRMTFADLPEMIRSKGFQLNNAEELQEDDRSLVKVSFKYSRQSEQELNYIRDGWVVLDPLRSWAIVRYEVHYEQPDGERGLITVSNEYRDPTGTSLKKSTVTLQAPNRSGNDVTEFVRYEHHGIPADDFQLAHYGLETPPADKVDQFGFVNDILGAAAPALEIRDARGVARDVKLSDYHGKWVLLEFWGPNCQPCLEHGLPELMAFYEAHRQQRAQFEVLAICVVTDEDGPKTIEQLDQAIAPAREKIWKGKSLPFPVLIDKDTKTFDAYGIRSAPATVLIDPNGLVVKDGDERLLAEKLNEKLKKN